MTDPNETYRTCPECNITNTVDFWDKHTKKTLNKPEEEHTFVSSGESKERLDSQDSYFHCPMCHAEVMGKDLIEDED